MRLGSKQLDTLAALGLWAINAALCLHAMWRYFVLGQPTGEYMSDFGQWAAIFWIMAVTAPDRP